MGVTEISGEIVGLGAWLVVSFLVAARVFRRECRAGPGCLTSIDPTDALGI